MKMKCHVQNGAKFLDEHCKKWYLYIDMEKLHLKFTNRCIVGQLESRYPVLMHHEMDNDKGFYIANIHNSDGTDKRRRCQWTRLKQLWLAEIRQRILMDLKVAYGPVA